MTREYNRLILFVLLIIFLVKVIYGLWYFQQWPLRGDELDYMHDARIMLEQGPLMMGPIEFETYVGPGFPWLLALSQWIYGTPFMILINALLSTLTLVIIYRLAIIVLPGIWALFPAIWSAVYVPFTMYTGSILKESLLQFLVPLSIWLLFKARNSAQWYHLVLSSFVYVYLIHTDERFVIFFPLYLIALVRRDEMKKSFKVILAFTVWFMLFCSPWIIRNTIVYERPVFLTERLHKPIDNMMGFQNELDALSGSYRSQMRAFRDSLLQGYNPTINFGREAMVREAIESGFIPHDFSWGERIWYNSLGYWSPIRTSGILLGDGWKYKGARSLMVNIFYSLNYGILLPFMLIGCFCTWRRRNWILQWMSIYLLIHYLFHALMFFGSGRYRHPLDFIIIILAFYGIYILFERLNWKFPIVNTELKTSK